MIKKLISLSDESIEMINKLKKKHGHLTDAEVLRTSLSVYYSRTFKDYVDIKTAPGRDPEEAARRKIEIQNRKEELEKERELDEKLAIVESLEGRVIEKNGIKYCRYFTHDLHKSYEQEISLLNLTDDLVNYQYAPSKALVLKARPKDFKKK